MTRLVIFLLVCVEIYFCSALYEETACKRLGGSCKYTSQCARARQRSGKCPRQPSNVKCCVPYQESACTRARGSCKYTHACSGTSRSGLCPTQPAAVKCCFSSRPKAGRSKGNNCGCTYNYASKCTGGASAGAKRLAAHFKRKFGGRTGIYSCRTVRGGRTTSLHAEGRAVDIFLKGRTGKRACNFCVYPLASQKTFAHQRFFTITLGNLEPNKLPGRLCYFFTFTSSPRNVKMVQTNSFQAFNYAKAIACANGIQEVIFNRRIWTKGKGERAYYGQNPHTDHVHIGLNKCGARNFRL